MCRAVPENLEKCLVFRHPAALFSMHFTYFGAWAEYDACRFAGRTVRNAGAVRLRHLIAGRGRAGAVVREPA
jgi:hypothetical protein